MTDAVDQQTTVPAAPRQAFTHTDHGVSRPDDYAWLRDKHAAESVAYLVAERAYYDAAVAPLADVTEQLRQEMVARIPPTQESVHWSHGGREYFTRDVPDQEYEQFCRIGADGDVEVLLDVNALLGADGDFVEIGVREVSPDGNWLAYSCDTEGDEVYELRFRDLRTGVDLPRVVAHTYYSGAWSADSTTFFYTVNNELYRPYQVWRHRIDDADAPDDLVFEDLDGRYDVEVHATRSGELIVVHTFNRDTSEVWIVPAGSPHQPASVVESRRPGIEYSVSHLPGTDGGQLLIVTNDGAPEFRVMRAPLASPGRDHWVEAIAENPEERVHGVHVFADHVVIDLVRDARQVLRVLPTAALANSEPTPGIDVVPDFPGGLLTMGPNEEFAVDEIITVAEGYLQPTTWWAVDLASGERRELKRAEAPGFAADRYVAQRSSVTARDGVEVPVTIVRHKDVALDGTAPLLLYGYGAYESAWWPGFEPALPSALDRGVVFAHAHIRGGGEGGRRWWLQGRMARKATTFTDFIDVADGLVERGWVDGSRIVSRGLSAGGLLQGAVYSTRPDRWAGVVAEVPFVDVVTTMFDASIPLTINEWDEWGDPRIREQFDWLLSYSPYDNVPGVEQPDAPPRPRLLVTGALNDPRVSVHEPAKWVAKLRASTRPGDAPVLFRVEIGDGGHTGPQGRFAAMGYEAEVYAWILDVMHVR